MMIGLIDHLKTKKLRMEEERHLKELERQNKWKSSSSDGLSMSEPWPSTSSFELILLEEYSSGEITSLNARVHNQMRTQQHTLARVCDQYDVSNSSAAALASAVL